MRRKEQEIIGSFHRRASAVFTVCLCFGLVEAGARMSQAPLILGRIQGQVVIEQDDVPWFQAAMHFPVVVQDTRGRTVLTSRTGQNGEFDVASLPAGNYNVAANVPTMTRLSVAIVIPAHRSPRRNSSRGVVLYMRPVGSARRSSAEFIARLELRGALLSKVGQDQNVRMAMIRSGSDHPDPEIIAKMAVIDRSDTAWLDATVSRIGWPTRHMVGPDGAEAAFTLLQHASHSLQQKLLPKVAQAYRAGDLPGWDYALLLDRVLVGNGKAQIYGTQTRPISDWRGHTATLFPLSDAANVDSRRAKVGLAPLSVYLSGISKMYFPDKPAHPEHR